MAIIITFAGFGLLAALSQRFGAESRKDFLRIDVSPAKQDDGRWLGKAGR